MGYPLHHCAAGFVDHGGYWESCSEGWLLRVTGAGLRTDVRFKNLKIKLVIPLWYV